MQTAFNLISFRHGLRNQGLSPLALIPIKAMPEPILQQIVADVTARREFQTLMLVGNSGPTFWRSLTSAERTQSNPIDTASCKRVGEALTAAGFSGWDLIYPANGMVPLQQLGVLAGWHYPSPLGLGVHPTWGPWFAYRAVVLLREALPELTEPQGDPPCTTCELQPCRAACPADALGGEVVDVERCLSYRLGAESDCANTCLARYACLNRNQTDQRLQ
jgi:hypothetical protein